MKTANAWLEETFGRGCRDPALLDAALTHRSAGNINNERLEFLGDAVLNCVVASMLFREFGTANEGDLSRFRATLVSEASLATIAAEVGLGERLRLGSGELKSGGFRRKSILADALEALFGAMYLDGGFEAAAAVIERVFAGRLERLPSADELKDPKTRLQEMLQARGYALPAYTVAAVTGEPHAQTFAVSCRIDALDLLETASGSSRRRAEQAAAERVLVRLSRLWGGTQ